MGTERADGGRATARTWWGLAVLALPSLVIALDLNALFLALPRLSADLGATGTQQLWILDSYGFLLAGFLVTMGNLGDAYGRRRLLCIGISAFGIASVAAAYSVTPAMLIASRAAMGVAAATLMPSTLALISNMFADNRQRATAIAVWATTAFAGAAFGPVLTGVLLQHFWWGSVFLINVPIMLVLLIAAPLLLPEFRAPATARLDLTSVLLSLLTVLPIVYGLKQLTIGATQPGTIAVVAILAGVAAGVVFARRQLVVASPLVNLRLFTYPAFSAVLLALLLAAVMLAGTGLLITQYLQNVLGYAPMHAALVFSPMAFTMAVATMATPALTRIVTPTRLITAGLAFSAAGYLVLTRVPSTGGLALVLVGIIIVALGTGPLVALGTGIVIGSVPRTQAGAAASLSETSNHFGSTLGVAALGTVSTVLYQHYLSANFPSGVDSHATSHAQQTLAGAVADASGLPGPQSAALLDAARHGYTLGVDALGYIGIVTFLVLAVVVGASFRLSHKKDAQQAGIEADRSAAVH